MVININVVDKRPTVEGAPVIVCGNSDYSIKFSFDDDWGASTYKTARFVYIQDGQVKHEDVDFTGSTVGVPPLFRVRLVRIGVFEGELCTTAPAVIPCESSILCDSGEPATPTPEQDARIMQLLNLAIGQQASATAAAASAAEAKAYADALSGDKANAFMASVDANPARCYPDENSILRPLVTLEPVQSGSGDPSPDNIRPIAGRTAVKLTRCGRNLIDMPALYARHTSTTTVTHSGSSMSVEVQNGTYAGARSDFMTLQAGVTYTLSARLTACDGNYQGLGFRLASGTFVGKSILFDGKLGEKTSTFTLTDDAEVYFAALVTSGTAASATATFADIQLEVGSAKTEYEPYRGDVFTLNLGRTVYGGTLDVATGVLTAHSYIALDGSENWTRRLSSSIGEYIFECNGGTPARSAIASNYGLVGGLDRGTNYVNILTDGRVQARFGHIETAEAFTAMLAQTPLQLVYVPAEADPVQLEPLPISALSGANTLHTDAELLSVVYCKSISRAFEEVLERLAALEGAAIE